MYPSTSDHELLHQIANRQVSALGELYDRHIRHVYALAVSKTRSTEEAEQAVQELFAEIWDAPSTLAKSEAIRTDILCMILQKVSTAERSATQHSTMQLQDLQAC